MAVGLDGVILLENVFDDPEALAMVNLNHLEFVASTDFYKRQVLGSAVYCFSHVFPIPTRLLAGRSA